MDCACRANSVATSHTCVVPNFIRLQACFVRSRIALPSSPCPSTAANVAELKARAFLSAQHMLWKAGLAEMALWPMVRTFLPSANNPPITATMCFPVFDGGLFFCCMHTKLLCSAQVDCLYLQSLTTTVVWVPTHKNPLRPVFCLTKEKELSKRRLNAEVHSRYYGGCVCRHELQFPRWLAWHLDSLRRLRVFLPLSPALADSISFSLLFNVLLN